MPSCLSKLITPGPLNAEVLAPFLYEVKLDKALHPLPINDDWVVMLSLMSYYSNLERTDLICYKYAIVNICNLRELTNKLTNTDRQTDTTKTMKFKINVKIY